MFLDKTLRSLNILSETGAKPAAVFQWLYLFVSEYTMSLERNPTTRAGGRHQVGLGWQADVMPFHSEICRGTATHNVELTRLQSVMQDSSRSLCAFVLQASLLQSSLHPSSFRQPELKQLSSAGNAPFPTNHPCKWQRRCRQRPCRVQAEQLTHSDWQPAKMTTSRSGCRTPHTGWCGCGTMPIHEPLSQFPPC